MKEKIKNYVHTLFELFKKFLKKFISIARRPEMKVLPGNLAFFLVVSFAPIVTLVALIASRFSISLLSILSDVRGILPNDVFQILDVFLNSSVPETSYFVIYLIVGFFTASNGAHSIIIASNTLYELKGGGFLKRRVKAFFLTFILVLQFVFILLFLVFGNVLMKSLLSFTVFDGIRDIFYQGFIWLKWPLTMFAIYVLIKLLYAIAPNKNVGSRYVTRGALFTTIGWTLVTAIYAYYANNLANYSVFYGSLSNLVVLMIWIYILSYILVMGIAINVSHYERK